MNVKLFIENDGFGEWRDFWISEEKIEGFYVPDEAGDDLGSGVNVYIGGNLFTLKQEAHLIKFLADKYV